MGVVVYPAIDTVHFEDYSLHDIPIALANTPKIASEKQSLRFVDFSYVHTVGEPIHFVLDKAIDRNCNSYNAKITDDNDNFVLGWGVDIDCDLNLVSHPVQTKIGYKENKPIIINESGKYYLEVEFIDAFTKREFVVRQNHGGATLDRTVYPVPWEDRPPLKQYRDGISSESIHCNENLILIQKYDGSPACVTEQTKEKLIERGWTNALHNVIENSPHPEPLPTPDSIQCRPGLPPFTSNFYLDGEQCKWKLIPEPIPNESIPYVWNAYLHKKQIDFLPKDRSYFNFGEGFNPEKENRVCSPLILSNGSEIYISSTFTIEPFELLDTAMSKTEPIDCYKIWKTEPLLVEPSPELGAWLKNYWEKENEN